MKFYKTLIFSKWAKKEDVSENALNNAIDEFLKGLYEAKLGKAMYKKRIPLKGKGKRGGARSIIFYQIEKILIFCFGYPKNVQEELDNSQRKKLEFLSSEFRKMKKSDFDNACKAGKLIQIDRGQEDGNKKENDS
jgi:hypothetical protein